LVDNVGPRLSVARDWPNWPGFSPRSVADLEAYHWPGNVRELRNVVERAVYRWEDSERAIDALQFDPFHSPWAPAASQALQAHAAVVSNEEPAAAPVEFSAPAASPPSSTNDFGSALADFAP